MATALHAFTNHEFDTIRTITSGGQVLFYGKDVTTALGYANTKDALARHCKGVVNHYPLETAGGIQQVRFISEGDLYRLIVSSKLPAAQQFEAWVFDDVLPSIRRHGMYAIDELLNDDEFLERAIAPSLRAERAKRLAAEQALLEAAPKVSYYSERHWSLFLRNAAARRPGSIHTSPRYSRRPCSQHASSTATASSHRPSIIPSYRRNTRQRRTAVLQPHSPARCASTASATGPALAVRMTCGPSRTVVAPAASSAAVSSELMPPSGPTTTAIAPLPARLTPPIGAVASSCSTSTVPPAWVVSRVQAASCAVVIGSATCGTRARRACLAAPLAVACQRSRPLATFGPFHWAMDRPACQGMTTSAPTSVAVSTACSSRPPLARAWIRTRA